MRDHEFPAPIQLVITDHVMPGNERFGVCASAAADASKMPVMVISGMADAEQEYAGLNVTFG